VERLVGKIEGEFAAIGFREVTNEEDECNDENERGD
jgi:hypothetical protein